MIKNISIFFLFISCVHSQLIPMDSEKKINDHPCMNLIIYPDEKYFSKKNKCMQAMAVVHGPFNKKHEVAFFDENECYKIHDKKYTPPSLITAIKDNADENISFPIGWHKQTGYFPHPKTTLEFFMKTCPTLEHSGIELVFMPSTIKRRMLRYFLKDASGEGTDGFHLCKNVVLERKIPGKKVADHVPLMKYMNFIDDQMTCKPGQMVCFFIRQPAEGHRRFFKLAQYAIALGQNLCLSKTDSGSLYVTTFNALKSARHYDGCVAIDGEIGKRNDFIKDPYRIVSFRSVLVEIHMYSRNYIGIYGYGYKVFLSGFSGLGNQVEWLSSAKGVINEKDPGYRSYERHYREFINGFIGSYLLVCHKKAHYLQGDEVLSFIVYDKENSEPRMLEIPNQIKKKFLEYLTFDMKEQRRNCFDLCLHLALNPINEEKLLDSLVSYDSMYELVEEADLKPGDAVMLSGNGPCGKHYAIYLGQGLYLSKFGNGSVIMVTDLASMERAYKTHKMGRIDPKISQYRSFLEIRLPS